MADCNIGALAKKIATAKSGPHIGADGKIKPGYRRIAELGQQLLEDFDPIPYTPAHADTGIQPDIYTEAVTNGNIYLANLIASGAFQHSGLIINSYKMLNEFADENIPGYKYTTDIISDQWNGNEHIKQIRHYVNPDSKLYMKMNKLRSSFNNSRQNMIQRMEQETSDLTKVMKKTFTTDAEIKKADQVFAQSAIFAIAENGVLNDIASGKTSLDSAIRDVEEKLFNGDGILVAKELSDLYSKTKSDKKEKSMSRNNAAAYNYDKQTSNYIDQLASLYTLQRTSGSVKMLRNTFTNNREFYNKITSLSIRVKAMDTKIHSTIHPNGKKDINVSRGNLIDDVLEHNFQMVAITKRESSSKEYEGNGWKALREPESDDLVIMYRRTPDILQEGVGLNTSYIKTGVPMSAKLHESYSTSKEYVVMETAFGETNKTYSLQLKEEELDTLGALNDPVKSLMRAYAHKELIAETQAIREIVANGMTMKYDSADKIDSEIGELIKTQDHPIFIEVPEGISTRNLSKEVQREYKVADLSILTDIGGFKRTPKLVRKDVAAEMVGFREVQPFKNHTAGMIFNTVKDIVRYAKINMIILNPAKIGMDFVSSMAVASAKGASIEEILVYGKEAVKFSKEMSDLRNKRLQLEFDLSVNGKNEKVANELAAINLEIKEHKFSPALAHGFIQSMGTELLVKDRESIQGLEADMLNLIRKLTQTDKGELTKFNNQVKRLANMGGGKFQMETAYAALGDKLEGIDITKGAGSVLNSMSKELAAIKNDKDMTKYIGELFATPGSQLVKLGGAMTLYADMVPRWILYNHNVNSGKFETEQDAAEDALLSLLDYKVQMPPSLKFMSDMYFMPFPSFFLRIQRVLLTMATKEPVSFATQLSVNAIVGNNGQNIVGSNFISKWGKDSIFSNPNDAIQNGGNLIPYANFFSFL